MSQLGERLRKARERANLKQIQVYERTKINNKTLSRYEHGGSEPDIETLKTLAELYNVSLEWLLTGETNESNQKKQAESHFFAKRLRKHRESCNLSIEDLAEKVGLTPHTIEKFEDGRGGIPGQKTLDKLSSILGVTRDYLLGYTNDPKGYGVGSYETDPKNLKEFIKNSRSLGFDGDELELDEEEREELLRHTRLAWMMIKEKRREKAEKRKQK